MRDVSGLSGGQRRSICAPNYGDEILQALDDIEVGSNYNRIFQIEDLVTDIVELTEEFGVGEFRGQRLDLRALLLDQFVERREVGSRGLHG